MTLWTRQYKYRKKINQVHNPWKNQDLETSWGEGFYQEILNGHENSGALKHLPLFYKNGRNFKPIFINEDFAKVSYGDFPGI